MLDPKRLPPDLHFDNSIEKRSLFVGAPAYGGMMHVPTHQSLAALKELCGAYGIEYVEYSITNDALVTRARNTTVDLFLTETKCTNFMWIDVDVGFKAMDVLHLFALQDNKSPYAILGAAYPRKSINWEQIRWAALCGVPADQLSGYVGDFVVNTHATRENQQPRDIDLYYPSEVDELGTGFMMVKRGTFEMMAERHPEWRYKPDAIRWDEFWKSQKYATAFFRDPIDPETLRHMSEDYQFCQDAQRMGLGTYVCPWIELTHRGSYDYHGSLAQTCDFRSQIRAAMKARQDAMKETKDAVERSVQQIQAGNPTVRIGSEGDQPEPSDRD